MTFTHDQPGTEPAPDDGSSRMGTGFAAQTNYPIQRAQARDEVQTEIPPNLVSILEWAWEQVDGAGIRATMDHDTIEGLIYDRYTKSGAVSEERQKALSAMSGGSSSGRTWQYGAKLSGSSSTYRMMFRIKPNNSNSEYFMAQLLEITAALGLRTSHKTLANSSQRSSRVDPLIVYTSKNPLDEQYGDIHVLVARAVEAGALETGQVDLYQEVLDGMYVGKQPSQSQKDKGAESFGMTYSVPIATGILSYFQLVSMGGMAATGWDSFASCCLTAIRDFETSEMS